MVKFKQWLYNKFLPAWCKDNLLEENARLKLKLADLKQENDRLNAYIEGLHDAMRLQKRVIIKNEGVKRE